MFLVRRAVAKGGEGRKILGVVATRGQHTAGNDGNYVDFGFETVKKEEKVGKVKKVFSSVAPNYDLMNDLMSAGVHRCWKDKMMQMLNPDNKTKLIDMAGGTGQFQYGDIATRFVNTVGKEYGTNVTVCDINEDMLKYGMNRAKKAGLNMNWQQCSADDLPFEDNTFNAYTISFGIRNCTDKDKVLSEAYRVLKPGGRFLCLEFSHIQNPMLNSIYQSYSHNVLPVMGECVANDWQSYKYLAESIAKFPTQGEFKKMIKNAGFQAVTFENLTFGVCSIHSGFKL